ncbi:anti-sigma factor [Aquipuribacter nitratireducens]|uniref:Regulator of SigK n=1 Tax=Aquipuribacter nitratireducens TaxID=650104 RepID=A0ABW0GR50_9MICO
MRPDAHALVAAYAADALDPTEREDVEAHLAECPVCRDDLDGFREALSALAAATAEAPPARMREAVLARARTTPQLPPETPAVPSPRSRTGTALTRPVLALAASVVAVLALALGVWGVTTAQRLDDVRAQQAAVQRVLAADDVESLAARPQLSGGVQGDEVVVLASREADAALLLPANLPAAPDGSTWQAWTIAGEEVASAGTFDVRSGEAVAFSAGIADVDAVAVSLEPSGGSEAPTTDPVLVVPLA